MMPVTLLARNKIHISQKIVEAIFYHNSFIGADRKVESPVVMF